MKRIIIIILVSITSVLSIAQTTYRATQVIKIIDGQVGKFVPDHSFIIVYSNEQKVEIKSEKATDQYYFYGVAGHFTDEEGEEWRVFNCRDKNGVKCRFVLRGKDQPVFEIKYEKLTICYYAEFISSVD